MTGEALFFLPLFRGVLRIVGDRLVLERARCSEREGVRDVLIERAESRVWGSEPGLSSLPHSSSTRTRSSSVGRADFDAFVERFGSAFERSGTATATRLLAFKRPDYFVCLDSKNRKQLCAAAAV
jgi:hypothetical protein